MRDIILNFLRIHPGILNFIWKVMRVILSFIAIFVPTRQRTMIITSFAGRKFDDSPKALYDAICKRKEFDDWDIIWVFVKPENFEIPRGRKIRIDTWSFFYALMYSKVWISNSGMDRGVGIRTHDKVRIETWHGTPLKKIGVDQNSNVLGNQKHNGKIDHETIRCAQSEFDRNVFARIMQADKKCFLMSDLPRNDGLLRYTQSDKKSIKCSLDIGNKRVILYMPTYREYLIDQKNQTYLAPPINLHKWEEKLGEEYVLLIRAHYAVSVALNIIENDFVRDVSSYPFINDLYIIADILISDYSSAFFDYSILDKPMLCFAYDEEEYKEKRGLYFDIHTELPCPIDKDENSLIKHINNMEYKKECENTRVFHMKYAPHAGGASKAVIDKLIEKLYGANCC